MRPSHQCSSVLFVSCIAILMSHPITAQIQHPDATEKMPGNLVTILANVDSSVVFIDADRKGLTPLSLSDLAPGTHHLVLQHPDAESWLTSSITDSIRVVAGQPLTLRFSFEPRYLIQSTPFDAEVVVGDSVIGKTPLRLSAGPFLLPDRKATFTIRKQGYETSTVDMRTVQRGVLSVTLRNLWDTSENHETLFRPDNGRISKPFRMTLAIAGTVLSGTAAAYFKIKADDRYLGYRHSGSPDLLAQSQRLDTAAAVALVATQIGLGLFMYFVLSD